MNRKATHNEDAPGAFRGIHCDNNHAFAKHHGKGPSVEVFELILIILACVVVSAVLDQVISRVSLPLIQIAIGFVVAFLLPSTMEAEVDPELFLVLFIAPLLFNEARHSNRVDLWNNKWPIVSLAIGLVLAIVVVVGFFIHALVPAITLAGAFACAAALGPTDAAAVVALGSTVSLSKRQHTLLSGEALINDASGVVAFQFAVAAALTGAFSVGDAALTFVRLFFGGIAFGVVLGFIFGGAIGFVRSRGLESTTVHVLYEVLTPFLVFLFAEAINVSGILAVVACGLVMSARGPRLASTAAARNRLVSRSIWDVIVFLINGVLFVMLGMQLPRAMSPTLTHGGLTPWMLIGIVLAISAVLILTRFVWTFVMELVHLDPATGERGWVQKLASAKKALIMTVAGPKGAVTLSIIFSLPYMYANGYPLESRDLIIFLTAGIILTTLLVADFALPRLAAEPGAKKKASTDMTVSQARETVLRGVIRELEAKIAENTRPDYEPATRLVISQYQRRIGDKRDTPVSDEEVERLQREILARQQARLSEVVEEGICSVPVATRYALALSRMRRISGESVSVGTRAGNAVRGIRLSPSLIKNTIQHLLNDEMEALGVGVHEREGGGDGAGRNAAHEVGRPSREETENVAKAGNSKDEAEREEMRQLAILMEEVAVAFLKEKVSDVDPVVSAAAVAELKDRYAVLEALRTNGENVGEEEGLEEEAAGKEPVYEEDEGEESPRATRMRAMRASVSKTAMRGMSKIIDPGATAPIDLGKIEVEQARLHMAEVESRALIMELDQIRQLHDEEKIDARTARRLREDVYLLQMSLSER